MHVCCQLTAPSSVLLSGKYTTPTVLHTEYRANYGLKVSQGKNVATHNCMKHERVARASKFTIRLVITVARQLEHFCALIATL